MLTSAKQTEDNPDLVKISPSVSNDAEAAGKKAKVQPLVPSSVSVGGSWADRVKAAPQATAVVKPQPVVEGTCTYNGSASTNS